MQSVKAGVVGWGVCVCVAWVVVEVCAQTCGWSCGWGVCWQSSGCSALQQAFATPHRHCVHLPKSDLHTTTKKTRTHLHLTQHTHLFNTTPRETQVCCTQDTLLPVLNLTGFEKICHFLKRCWQISHTLTSCAKQYNKTIIIPKI